MPKLHTYELNVRWTGNTGSGTDGYRSYERAHEVTAEGLPAILGTADPAFLGDPARWNPEQLLLAALAQCHMLSYLAVCALNKVVVTSYTDDALGTMAESKGSGRFTDVLLRPRVEVADPSMVERAVELHEDAHRVCFIANSVNFPVRHEASVVVSAEVPAAE